MVLFHLKHVISRQQAHFLDVPEKLDVLGVYDPLSLDEGCDVLEFSLISFQKVVLADILH
jgi:hypothetical protein